MSLLHPLVIIVALQVAVVGGVALAAHLWIRRQKNTVRARARVVRFLFGLMVTVAVVATVGQVFMYATGRSPDWLPHPAVFGSLAMVGILHAQATRKARDQRVE